MMNDENTLLQALRNRASDSDWPEDYDDDNGFYYNICNLCGVDFTGHKRRVICRNATIPKPPRRRRMCIMSDKKTGPIYGVELIHSLPVGTGGMRQAMPSRADLQAAKDRHTRLVAGYEVLLGTYQETEAELARLREDNAHWLAWHEKCDSDPCECLLEAETKARREALEEAAAVVEGTCLTWDSPMKSRIAEKIRTLATPPEPEKPCETCGGSKWLARGESDPGRTPCPACQVKEEVKHG